MLDVCLAILMDSSGSINDNEWRLQVEGTANAIRHPETVARIQRQGGIAINAMGFSSIVFPMVPWTSVTDQASADAFAAKLISAVRTETLSTAAGSALSQMPTVFETAPPCTQKVVDISADGTPNEGRSLAEGVAVNMHNNTMVNAIIIEDTEPDVLKAYEETVNGFTIPATWELYEQSIKRKLNLEIAYHRLPPTRYALERRGDDRYFAYRWDGGLSVGPSETTILQPNITPPAYHPADPVPSPGLVGLLGMGLIGLAAYRRTNG